MAYPIRRRAPARKAPVRRVASKKTVSVAKKVTTLARTVKKLTKISYDKVTMAIAKKTGQDVVQPFYQYHINGLISTWAPIFGSNTADIQDADKIYVNSYMVDMRLAQDNESDRIWYTAYVVSLKDQAADSTTFDPATGALFLTDGVQFTTLGTNGRVMINPKFFNIHAYKRFTMGGRSGDQSTPEVRDLSFKIVPKQKLMVNPRGNVLNNASFNFPKDPSQNYYVLLFNDDAAGDLQTNKIFIGGVCNLAIPS